MVTFSGLLGGPTAMRNLKCETRTHSNAALTSTGWRHAAWVAHAAAIGLSHSLSGKHAQFSTREIKRVCAETRYPLQVSRSENWHAEPAYPGLHVHAPIKPPIRMHTLNTAISARTCTANSLVTRAAALIHRARVCRSARACYTQKKVNETTQRKHS